MDNTSFSLFLTIVVSLLIIETSIATKLRKKANGQNRPEDAKDSATTKEAKKGCPHFFGYLAEHPGNRQVPEECFGCQQALDCLNATRRIEVKKTAQ